MNEPKIRYRIPPCADYNIPAMEAWLEDMAAKGLHLAYDGFFLGLGHFEEGPPKQVRYRLEPSATEKYPFSRHYDPKDDAVQLHSQMGWFYRARWGQFHIYATYDPDAPELNTDPQVQAISMAALTKYLNKRFRSVLLLIVLNISMFYSDLLVSGAIWMGTWWMLSLVALLLARLGSSLWELLTVAGYRRRLQRGEPIAHRTDYRRRGTDHLIRKAIWWVLYAAMLIAIIAHDFPLMTREVYMNLDNHTAPLPFATLQELYPEAVIDRQNGILESEIYAWSDPISPENYDLTEYAAVTLDGQTFDCYLTVSYHRTRWEWTARVLAREMVSQTGANPYEQGLASLLGGEPAVVTEITLPDADYCVYYYNNLPDPYLVIQQNEVVLRIRYAPLGNAPQWEPEELARLFLSKIR